MRGCTEPGPGARARTLQIDVVGVRRFEDRLADLGVDLHLLRVLHEDNPDLLRTWRRTPPSGQRSGLSQRCGGAGTVSPGGATGSFFPRSGPLPIWLSSTFISFLTGMAGVSLADVNGNAGMWPRVVILKVFADYAVRATPNAMSHCSYPVPYTP